VAGCLEGTRASDPPPSRYCLRYRLCIAHLNANELRLNAEDAEAMRFCQARASPPLVASVPCGAPAPHAAAASAAAARERACCAAPPRARSARPRGCARRPPPVRARRRAHFVF
jgi:hypothetical protein